MSQSWRTSPDHENTGWPPGVPYIIGNEGCERFSFYGMKAILYLHFVSLFTLAGAIKEQAERSATSDIHTFIAAVYFFPLIGALLADRLIGKYRTTFWLSLLYCVGHGIMSAGDFLVPEHDAETKLMMVYAGLGFIAVGAGGIKPVVSANVGDQFGRANWHRVPTMFQAFYFIINFGSAFSTLLIPWLRDTYSPGVAFLIPGILMGIATLFFWLGRNKYVHVPARPAGKLGVLDVLSGTFLLTPIGVFLLWHGAAIVGWSIALIGMVIGFALFNYRQNLEQDDGFLAVMIYTLKRKFGFGQDMTVVENVSAEMSEDHKALHESGFWGPAARAFGAEITEGPLAVLRIISVMILVSVFWGLFDQHSSTWIGQAEKLNRDIWVPLFGDLSIAADQIPALNPFMVMILLPLVNIFYRFFDNAGRPLKALTRMTIGMYVTAAAFAIVTFIEMKVESEGANVVSVYWQVLPYFVITLAEVLVSVTGLEFAYTQAPKRMKSIIMSFWMLTVSFGSKLVSTVVEHISFDKQSNFFLFFSILMTVAAFLFGIRAKFYTPKDYTQD